MGFLFLFFREHLTCHALRTLVKDCLVVGLAQDAVIS